MDLKNSAQELLAHDGILAVGVSVSADNTVAVSRDPYTLQSMCSHMINMYRGLDLKGTSRLVVNDDVLGPISVVTNAVDDVLVSVVVQTGHNVCKSLQRMIKRAITRAKKGTKIRMTSVQIPEAVA